ncbi:MAG: hypothetical protein BAJATHORv1_30236 [Candidatus Thorarchaeota archaeon]|nr:MAG: hypothetical protein BAJATHORv1_30236 [Candidatus Thorarchaeota archaeon]
MTAETRDEFSQVLSKIEKIPSPHKENVLDIWERWLESKPQQPYFEDWFIFAQQYDNQQELFTETRVYIRMVRNALKDLETPKTIYRKVRKAIVSIASFFFVIFLAISRFARAGD